MKGQNDAGDGQICNSCQRPLRTDGSCPKCEAAEILAEDFSDSEISEDDTTVETIDGGFRSEKPGDMVGNFKLIEKIGEGGFGVVWLAKQQEPVRRTVALKILKAGMDTREVVARFEAERQALALMDHYGIAKVYEAGATGGGRPFFAMELVSGEPITEFCKSQNIPTRERLELFVSVCAAVQHAHQKGIIHRDIKPSNILVAYGEQGHPVSKIIDFGIAKATQLSLTEKTLHTRVGQLLGTPAYMSPEQAGVGPLDIDTRTDIYGLGVLLYELLSGRPPFEPETMMEAGYEEMLRILREKEPPRPSQRLSTLGGEEQATLARAHGMDIARLGRMVRGDLDWIVMKAMEKGRARRYETASAMGEDVTRYLASEPVVARPPSALYRFGKYARRNRAALMSVSVMVLLLVGGTVASWNQALRANRSAEAEANARIKAQEAQAQSETALETAFVGLESLHSDFSESMFENLPGLTIEESKKLKTGLNNHLVERLTLLHRDRPGSAEIIRLLARIHLDTADQTTTPESADIAAFQVLEARRWLEKLTEVESREVDELRSRVIVSDILAKSLLGDNDVLELIGSETLALRALASRWPDSWEIRHQTYRLNNLTILYSGEERVRFLALAGKSKSLIEPSSFDHRVVNYYLVYLNNALRSSSDKTEIRFDQIQGELDFIEGYFLNNERYSLLEAKSNS